MVASLQTSNSLPYNNVTRHHCMEKAMFSNDLPPSAQNVCSTLLIEDNASYCNLIDEFLSIYGFKILACHTGKEGISTFKEALDNGMPFDLVIIDLFLPDTDGFQILKTLRALSHAAMVMLSAHNEETDRIVCLEMGADDYIPKSYSSREILARIRAALRRRSNGNETAQSLPASIDCSGLHLSRQTLEVTLDGKTLPLTVMEFNILYILASMRGTVLSREDILHSLGEAYSGKYDRSIDVHIASLRRKLGEDINAPRFIKTLRGKGYKFIL